MKDEVKDAIARIRSIDGTSAAAPTQEDAMLLAKEVERLESENDELRAKFYRAKSLTRRNV